MEDAVDDLVFVPSARVGIRVSGLPTLSPQQLVKGHPRTFALDVPQRLVDAGDGVVEHGAVPPIAVDHRHLPRLLDPVDVTADQERVEVLFDRGVDGPEALGKRRATQPVKSIVRCEDLYYDEPGAGRLSENGLDIGDCNCLGH